MRDRIKLLYNLLSDDGTLFVHIDDANLAYITIVLDEIFGRSNRLYLITFKQGAATGHKAINPGCVTAAVRCTSQIAALSGKTRQIGAVDRRADYRFTTIGQTKAREMY